MLKNNIEIDIKTKCIEAEMTQAKLAEKIHISAPYVNRIVRGKEPIVNQTFLKMMETLGYDVEIKYVKNDNDR